jgi:hypothetical protein
MHPTAQRRHLTHPCRCARSRQCREDDWLRQRLHRWRNTLHHATDFSLIGIRITNVMRDDESQSDSNHATGPGIRNSGNVNRSYGNVALYSYWYKSPSLSQQCTSAPTSTPCISRRLGGPNGRPGGAVIVLPGVDGIPQRRDCREASKDDAGVVHRRGGYGDRRGYGLIVSATDREAR